MRKKQNYKLVHRKGRCVQVMFKDTNVWISSGCNTKAEATLWAEAKLGNKTGFVQVPDHNGYKLRHEVGRNIRVKFDDSDKWVSTGYDDELNATIWADTKLRERRKKDVTLREFSEGFYTRTDATSFRARNINSQRYYTDHYYLAMNGRLENYILPYFGDMYMSNIDHILIDSWFLRLKKATKKEDLSPDSKNKVLQCLSNIFEAALFSGVVPSNPCKIVRKVAEHNQEREALDYDEMEILFPENDRQAIWIWGSLKWACYFHIMKCTGFRPGEIAGLERSHYYKELGGLYTTQSVNSYNRKVVSRIKTSDKGMKYKIGLLSDQCVRLLDEYIATLPAEEKFLFKVDGEMMITDTSNKHFKTCAKRAGLDLRGRSQYSLRHTFQTMIAGEIERGSVEELMGHTKYRKGYDHRAGEKRLQQLQGLRETLNKII
jgi:integrase